MWIIEQCGESLESFVEWFHIFKRLSAETVAKACTVVDLHNFSSFIQPNTITVAFIPQLMDASEILSSKLMMGRGSYTLCLKKLDPYD